MIHHDQVEFIFEMKIGFTSANQSNSQISKGRKRTQKIISICVENNIWLNVTLFKKIKTRDWWGHHLSNKASVKHIQLTAFWIMVLYEHHLTCGYGADNQHLYPSIVREAKRRNLTTTSQHCTELCCAFRAVCLPSTYPKGPRAASVAFRVAALGGIMESLGGGV